MFCVLVDVNIVTGCSLGLLGCYFKLYLNMRKVWTFTHIKMGFLDCSGKAKQRILIEPTYRSISTHSQNKDKAKFINIL